MAEQVTVRWFSANAEVPGRIPPFRIAANAGEPVARVRSCGEDGRVRGSVSSHRPTPSATVRYSTAYIFLREE